MAEHPRAIVVGAGIIGASIAWHLARRGAQVRVLEQFELPHTRGSSHGASRIFRLGYPDVEFVRLVRASLPRWREIERLVPARLLMTTGALDIGPRSELEPVAGALEAAGAPAEWIPWTEARRRFPAFRLREGFDALLQPDGGVLFAGECWRAFLALATGTGAVIMPHTRARAIGERSWGVRVETGSGTLDADLAVVAAAGWSGELLKPLGLDVPLTITAEHVGYYPLRSGVSLLPFIWHDPAARQLFYGLPDGSGPWLKAGEHGAGPIVDSETEVYPEPARLEAIDRLVDALLPGAEPSRVEGHTCLYAATPDDDFVLDRAGPIMLAAGFGGHGFKFAPLIGELVAALALGDASAIPSRFALKRFDRVRSRLPMVPGQG